MKTSQMKLVVRFVALLITISLSGSQVYANNLHQVKSISEREVSHYESIIREDLTWEYLCHSWTFDHHSYELQRTGFNGTVIIQGTEWHRYVLKESERWLGISDDYGQENPNISDLQITYKGIFDGENTVLALIREENGKVYIYKTDEELESIMNYHFDDNDNEVLLYDFSTKIGDSNLRYVCYGPRNEMQFLMTTETQSKEEVNIAGRSLQKITESIIEEPYMDYDCNLYIIEGIGNVGCGDFISYSYKDRPLTTGFEDDFKYFSRLLDSNGNVMYESPYYPSKLATVAQTISEVQDGRMYDVMGREISNPQPGTIYIQNGRKLIAR